MTENSSDSAFLYRAISDAESEQIRKELRERQFGQSERTLDDWRESKKIFAEHTHAIRMFSINSAADHGKIFIRFMFLLNGGAIVALLALIGTIFGKSEGSTLIVVINFAHQIKISFYFFVAGLVFTAATAATGYLNWSFVFRTYFNEGQTTAAIGANDPFGGQDKEQVQAEFNKFDRWADRTVWIAITFAVASLIAFIVGSLRVASAFSVLGMV